MPVERMEYSDARSMMKPGDVIAFGGKGHFSELIKFVSRADVSHVGVILQTRVVDDDTGRFFNQIVESTSINNANGVVVTRLSDRMNTYEGEIWWLPLDDRIRQEKFDSVSFYNFLFNQARDRKGYDVPQALKSALYALDELPFGLHGPGYNREDFSRFFCSELVAAGLEKAGTVGPVNASEVTPIDLCRWKIYADTCFQLKGEADKQISRYNSLDPAAWKV